MRSHITKVCIQFFFIKAFPLSLLCRKIATFVEFQENNSSLKFSPDNFALVLVFWYKYLLVSGGL